MGYNNHNNNDTNEIVVPEFWQICTTKFQNYSFHQELPADLLRVTCPFGKFTSRCNHGKGDGTFSQGELWGTGNSEARKTADLYKQEGGWKWPAPCVSQCFL